MNRPFLFAAYISIAAFTMTSCQNTKTKGKEDQDSVESLSAKAIEVHDEIMPQISKFDKTSVKLDSLLNALSSAKTNDPTLDTTAVRTELTTLKADIESATDAMMDWMRNYRLDSLDATYQSAEVERIKAMRGEFETVNKRIDSVMNVHNK
ncbi:hypothetical protein ACFSQ3_01510 [Sphingobacterium corticis]|uniref:Transposase n=1 Tax=Sphingobacterium corticis TaxID=1812823 RepID=A0ABW5NGD7_9SPHI